MVNDWRAALATARDVLGLCEDVPEAGQEYAESVYDTVSSIMETISSKERVTDRQIMALENMKAGLVRWIEDDVDDIPF